MNLIIVFYFILFSYGRKIIRPVQIQDYSIRALEIDPIRAAGAESLVIPANELSRIRRYAVSAVSLIPYLLTNIGYES